MPVSVKRPEWLNKKINLKDCNKVKMLLNGLRLNTVCQEASCPNIGECFLRGEATFMILGRICTRNCRFCNVEKGDPSSPEEDEPLRVTLAARRLNLKHVVITSVTRDDLPLGGADIFAKTISSIKKELKDIIVEVLIPDFELEYEALKKVAEAKPNIIGHNLETVPALYKSLRPMADYKGSLEVLRLIKKIDDKIYTKSGMMLGLGEKEEDIFKAFYDLREAGCDFLSLGQYLRPSLKHYPVKEYLKPEKFIFYKDKADKLGFLHTASAPYVRSSYKASEYLEKVNEDKTCGAKCS